MQSLELTLIVAATRNMGIGAQGGMPWQGLRKEMKYFARVTTRLPPQAGQGNKGKLALTYVQAPPSSLNAVIMGRKTWDSIPTKFRPLKDRLNIVISRSAPSKLPDTVEPSEPVRVQSLELALQYARARSDISRVFVIGGAQIYDAALKLPEARRILLTSIERDFDCDTFFPVDLKGGSWQRKSREQLQEWTGEEVEDGGQEEAGTKYEFQMWEKHD
ncbi:dihydrofolate reductase [Fusarium longipes]|uniref:Dihydrofolate reductase n=1 Tax=Fusarium longipes TaxID=694270 RepID=A0A395T066_9HYPO|nr:dihydrofolate reductase [Fusarium longipes]